MKDKSISRIRLLCRHLTVRLMVVSFLAIVPLNILSMVLITQIVNVYQERLVESYRSQMELQSSRLEAKLQYIDNAMNGYLSAAQVYELSYGASGSDAVSYVRIYNDIKNIRLLSDMPALSYLTNNQTDLCSLSYQPHRYQITMLKSLKDALTQRQAAGGSVNYRILQIENTVFLEKRYEFTRYSLGFLVDAQRMLQEIHALRSSDAELLYLVDAEGTLLCGLEGALESTEMSITRQGLLEDDTLVVIEEPVPLLGFRILRVIPRDSLAEDVPELIGFFRVLVMVTTLSLPLIWLLVTRLVLRPLRTVVKALGKIKEGNLEYRLSGKTGSFQMDYIYQEVNHMAQEIKSLTIESYEKEIAKLQTDSVNLRLQVRPHTLLNSLSTFYNLVQAGENKCAMEFSLNLISYFRYVLRQSEALVPIEAEMKFVKDYLTLQKVRFPNSFAEECSVDPQAAQIRVPPLIIESFVENAVKYALVMGTIIQIDVWACIVGECVHIDVTDTGCGMDAEKAAALERGEIVHDDLGNHIGVWNSVRRLRLYYGGKAVFRITSAPGQGTKIHMELPKEPQDVHVTARDIAGLPNNREVQM